MKQIKTITERRDYEETFDRRVNEALTDGWELKRRYISNGRVSGATERLAFYPVLVAELEKEVPDAE
jgi:hypothetical protein